MHDSRPIPTTPCALSRPRGSVLRLQALLIAAVALMAGPVAGPGMAQDRAAATGQQDGAAVEAMPRTRITPVPLTQTRIPAGAAPPATQSPATRSPATQSRTTASPGTTPSATEKAKETPGKPKSSARSPQPFPEFTFKRVTPPSAGAGRRITVQIAPLPTPRAPVAGPADDIPAARAPKDRQTAGWFWDAVSPALAKAAPHRFLTALAQLDKAPAGMAIAAPRLQDLQAIARVHGRDLLVSSIGTGVSPAFALAVIAVESAGRQGAVSPVGARGVMQLMPATAARFGVDPDISAQNIRGGIAYLDWLLKRFQGDPLLALAGYNAGENAVARHQGVPPFAETRAYVPKVLAAWRVARGLCLTPPELVSDGCVFALESASK